MEGLEVKGAEPSGKHKKQKEMRILLLLAKGEHEGSRES